MSARPIEHVIDRLISDPAFRTKYRQDPDRALESYLTEDEIRAIKTGDCHRIEALGQTERWEHLTRVLCRPDPGD